MSLALQKVGCDKRLKRNDANDGHLQKWPQIPSLLESMPLCLTLADGGLSKRAASRNSNDVCTRRLVLSLHLNATTLWAWESPLGAERHMALSRPLPMASQPPDMSAGPLWTSQPAVDP